MVFFSLFDPKLFLCTDLLHHTLSKYFLVPNNFICGVWLQHLGSWAFSSSFKKKKIDIADQLSVCKDFLSSVFLFYTVWQQLVHFSHLCSWAWQQQVGRHYHLTLFTELNSASWSQAENSWQQEGSISISISMSIMAQYCGHHIANTSQCDLTSTAKIKSKQNSTDMGRLLLFHVNHSYILLYWSNYWI